MNVTIHDFKNTYSGKPRQRLTGNLHVGRGMGPISNEALQQSHLLVSEQEHATYKGDCAVSQKKMLLPGV